MPDFDDTAHGGDGALTPRKDAQRFARTLLLGHVSSNAMVPAITPKMPYAADKDFTAINLIGSVPQVVVVPAASPARTLAEFIALANHRKTLRAEIARYAELYRTEQIKTITAAMARYDVPFDEFSPTVLMVLMTGATQVLVQEELLGVSAGHEETLQFAARWLTFLEGPRQLDPNWRHAAPE